MAAKFAAQDDVISDLVGQLAEEKRARSEEREAREKSIALVRAGAERESKHTSTSSLEDLGIRNAKGHGKWGHGSVDMSGDSDAESLNAESVFSRSRSPTGTVGSRSSGPSVAGTVESTPEIAQAAFARVVQNPAHTANSTYQPRPKALQQKSTFQKILTGLSGAGEDGKVAERDRYDSIGMGETGCSNCRGKDASVAWDTVGLLRAENRGLKDRVGSLESAVEGALDLCDGLHVG